MYTSASVNAGTGALTAQVTHYRSGRNSTRNITSIANFDRRLLDLANPELDDCRTDGAS